jgi:hypothetical protein
MYTERNQACSPLASSHNLLTVGIGNPLHFGMQEESIDMPNHVWLSIWFNSADYIFHTQKCIYSQGWWLDASGCSYSTTVLELGRFTYLYHSLNAPIIFFWQILVAANSVQEVVKNPDMHMLEENLLYIIQVNLK